MSTRCKGSIQKIPTKTISNEPHVMRTSPRWLHARRHLPEVTSRLQLGRHVRLGFSRHVRTVSAISPTYDVETSHSLMRWNGDDDAVDLVLVLAPEGSWIMLCDHEKVLCHLFWAFSGFVSCRAFGPCWGRPPRCAPNPRTSLLPFKLSSRRRLDLGFV